MQITTTIILQIHAMRQKRLWANKEKNTSKSKEMSKHQQTDLNLCLLLDAHIWNPIWHLNDETDKLRNMNTAGLLEDKSDQRQLMKLESNLFQFDRNMTPDEFNVQLLHSYQHFTQN